MKKLIEIFTDFTEWWNKPALTSLEVYINENKPKTHEDVEQLMRQYYERERLVRVLRARGDHLAANWVCRVF